MQTSINLASLLPQQAEAIKKQLDGFLYTAGTNVALLNALEKPQAKSFHTKIIRALTLQIFHIAELEKIFKVLQTVKKQQDDIILEQIQSYWLPFDQSLIQGKTTLLLFLLFAANEGGQAGLDKMVPQFKFNLTNQVLRKELQARVDFLIKSVDQTGIDWVARKIELGIKNNLTAIQITKLLRQEVKDISKQRGALITETELMVGMNLVEMEVYRRNGIRKVKWIVQFDERVCEICLANEAAGAILLGEEFPMGTASPPSHPNCRCFLLPSLPVVISGQVWTGG